LRAKPYFGIDIDSSELTGNPKKVREAWRFIANLKLLVTLCSGSAVIHRALSRILAGRFCRPSKVIKGVYVTIRRGRSGQGS
jgi:hypothetical protein